MNDTTPPTDTAATAAAPERPPASRRPNRRQPANVGQPPQKGRPPAQRQHPVLDQLAQLYPALFGEVLKPLKRGIFQDLLDAQPGVLEAEGLKAALALHTRSSRYLSVVASGQQRHDLAGQPVEPLTPEQVHHALVEVFRRRQGRTREDLVPKLRQRIAQAFEASGLGQEAYAAAMLVRDEVVNEITRQALADATARTARDAALLRAFEASGQPLETFADMYGMGLQDAQRTLERARARNTPKD